MKPIVFINNVVRFICFWTLCIKLFIKGAEAEIIESILLIKQSKTVLSL